MTLGLHIILLIVFSVLGLLTGVLGIVILFYKEEIKLNKNNPKKEGKDQKTLRLLESLTGAISDLKGSLNNSIHNNNHSPLNSNLYTTTLDKGYDTKEIR